MSCRLSSLLLVLFVALMFAAGCNPPSNPTCSSYIGQATINEVSKVQAGANNANDFVEIKIMSASISATTLNSWNIQICRSGTSTCPVVALSTATVTGSGANRYYVLKSATNIAAYIDYVNGSEIALADENNYVVDYLSIAGNTTNKPTCTFSNDTDATSTSTTRRMRRNADGTGNWETVTANDQPATEGLDNTAMPAIAAEWRMEQNSWNGTSGEVAATTSTINGTAKNSATTANTSPNPALNTNPGSCRFGKFTSSSNQYVSIPDDDVLDFATSSLNFTAMTFSAWIYPQTASTQGTIISKGIMTSSTAGDYAYAMRLYSSTRIDFQFCQTYSSGSCSSYSTVSATSATSLLNTWTHVAVSFHSGYQKIYLNGVEATASSTVGVLTANTRPLFVGNTPNAATSPTGYYYPFNGMIDEVRFYRAALTQAQVQTVRAETHACTANPTDHFSVSPSTTSAVTCDAITVTVAPHTSAETSPTSYSGTVTLTATLTPPSGSAAAAGTWSLVTGSGTFTAGSAGTATYQFVSGETSAVFRYKSTSAGTVNFSAVDGSITTSENSAVTFSTAGFVFLVNGSSGAVPTQIAGKDSNAGWNLRTLAIRAVTTDPTTGVCTARLPAGAQTIDFAYDCTNPGSCSASPTFNITGSGSATAIPANASTPTSWQSVSLTFDSSATAPFVMNYNDAGQVQLYVRKVLTDSNSGPAVTLSGNTSITVRPFGFGLTNIVSGTTSNPAGTANGGSKFVPAGSSFSASVAAYRYASGEDTDSNGVPDSGADVTNNGTTPNFAFTGAAVSMPTDLLTPSLTQGGIVGTLSAPTTLNFTAGAGSLSSMTYSEVGSLRLRVSAADYLGVSDADIQGDSADIGRFYPQQFVLTASTVTPTCRAGTTAFTYLDQNALNVSFTLQARNASGAVTQNYDTSAGYLVGEIEFVAENGNDGNDLSSRVAATVGRWDAGVYVVADGAANYSVTDAYLTRAPSDADPQPDVDGPFNDLQLGIDLVNEPDGRDIASLDMQADAAGACSSCSHKKIGAAQVFRYGRLAMRDATGSELANAISMPVFAEYYNGADFTRNFDDTENATLGLACTQYGSGTIDGVVFSNFTGNLAATDFSAANWHLPAAATALQSGAMQRYPNGLYIVPVAKTGSVDITLTNVPAWLQYDWNSADADQTPFNPSATLTLGQNRGNDRVILWREIH